MTNCAACRCYTQAMEIIYADSLFLSNLMADYLLCLCSARICALPLRRLRYFMAALLGAAYSVLVFVPGFAFLGAALWKAVFGGLMALIAFAGERRAPACAGVFLALSAALGGALWALELNFGYIRLDLRLLTLYFLLAYGALRLIFSAAPGASGHGVKELEIHLLRRSCRLCAMEDSGNCLTDPLSGAPVAVVCPQAVRELFGSAAPLLDISDPVELISSAAAFPELAGRLRLIPFSALGGGGLLPVFKPDRLLIDGREDRDRLVALSPKAAGPGFDGIV